MADQKVVMVEVLYGSTKYYVNLYGARIGKIQSKIRNGAHEGWHTVERGSPLHDAIKKKAQAMIANFKEDRKKK